MFLSFPPDSELFQLFACSLRLLSISSSRGKNSYEVQAEVVKLLKTQLHLSFLLIDWSSVNKVSLHIHDRGGKTDSIFQCKNSMHLAKRRPLIKFKCGRERLQVVQ